MKNNSIRGNKSYKGKSMKEKKSFKIIKIIAVIIIIFAIGIILEIRRQENLKKTLRQISEFYKCEFVKLSNSTEIGYSKKLYWNYYVSPVDYLDTTSYKEYYEEVLKVISGQIKQNFILIDEKNSLEIRVKYNRKNNSIVYSINDDKNFFQNELNKQIAKTQNNENKITNFDIKSQELIDTIANDWSRKKTESSYGKKIKVENNYDVYSKGIMVRTVNSKIFNMVFTTDYKGNVFNNITTGMDIKNIYKILGNPTYENEQANILIGYKTDKYYAFFTNGQVSIYPIENFDEEKNKQFANIVQEYNNEPNNYDEILKKITEIYPDYSEYEQGNDRIDLKYPLKGLEVKMGNNEKNGIYIYNNYNGYIMPDIKRENFENQKVKNVYLISEDLVYNEELKRAMQVKTVK